MASERLVAIVGAGRMGRGIALALAYAGQQVALIDIKPRPADEFARLATEVGEEIRRDLEFLVRVDALDEAGIRRVEEQIGFFGAGDAGERIAAASMLFEGVPETLEAKRACFDLIGRHCGDDCLVASTTSTIDANILSDMMPGPERFLNAHWLNPAHLMPLVEMSPGARTSGETVERMRAFLKACGKVPILCRASPGYIVPRIQALAMNEAARMVEEGIATTEDIDTAIRVGFGLRFSVLGLLEFIDWGGCDILHHASQFLGEGLDPDRFRAPEVIGRHMAEHRRGLRDGAGFYDYAGVDVAAYRETRMRAFVGMLRARDLMPCHRSNTPRPMNDGRVD